MVVYKLIKKHDKIKYYLTQNNWSSRYSYIETETDTVARIDNRTLDIKYLVELPKVVVEAIKGFYE